jgi:hypothetical protein
MRRNDRSWAASLALAVSVPLLLATAGCDGKPSVNSSMTEEGTVHGKVTLDGNPVTGGEVVFSAANYQRKTAPSHSAPIGADGTYTVKTLTGLNSVMVNPDKDKRNQKKTATVPHRMLDFDVGSGDNNNFDITLTTPARPLAAN